MGKSIKSHPRQLWGIAVRSLGYLSTIIGILSAVYALDMISKSISGFVPFVLISASTLTAGIYLLTIRWRKSLAEWRKMPAEEKAVKVLEGPLRNRKGRIVAVSFLLIIIVSSSMWLFWRERELNQMATPQQIRRMASFENPERELPVLFSRFYVISAAKAKVIFWECSFGLIVGFLVVMLISEFSGLFSSKNRLLLSMWEEVKQLEDEVRVLKARAQSDDRQIGGQNQIHSPI